MYQIGLFGYHALMTNASWKDPLGRADHSEGSCFIFCNDTACSCSICSCLEFMVGCYASNMRSEKCFATHARYASQL